MNQENNVEQEILRAGNEIESKGKNVTPWGLRAEIGKGTPKKMFKIWSSLNGTEEEAHDGENSILPKQIQFSVDKLTNQITNNLNNIVQESTRVVSDIYEERSKVIQDSNEKKYMILKQDLETAEKVIELSDQKNKELLDELNGMREQIKGSEQDKIKLMEVTTELRCKNDLLKERSLLIQEKDINFSNLKNDFEVLHKRQLMHIKSSNSSSDILSNNTILNS